GARDDGGRLGAEVHQHLGTEWLGEVGGHPDPAVGARIRLDARVLEVLRPDSQNDVLAYVVAEARAVAGELVVNGQLVLAGGDLEIAVAPGELRLDQIDRRRPDEAGDERVHPLGVGDPRRVDRLPGARI